MPWAPQAVAAPFSRAYAASTMIEKALTAARNTMALWTAGRRRLPKLLLAPAAGLAMCILHCGPAVADVTVKPAARGYDIDIAGGTSASELIDAIANATGVEIKGEPEDATVGPNHLRNASLERALRMLLPKAPFAVRYDADDTPETIVFLSPSEDSADGGDNGDAMDDGSGMEPDQSDPGAPDMEQDPPDTGG